MPCDSIPAAAGGRTKVFSQLDIMFAKSSGKLPWCAESAGVTCSHDVRCSTFIVRNFCIGDDHDGSGDLFVQPSILDACYSL